MREGYIITKSPSIVVLWGFSNGIVRVTWISFSNFKYLKNLRVERLFSTRFIYFKMDSSVLYCSVLFCSVLKVINFFLGKFFSVGHFLTLTNFFQKLEGRFCMDWFSTWKIFFGRMTVRQYIRTPVALQDGGFQLGLPRQEGYLSSKIHLPKYRINNYCQ